MKFITAILIWVLILGSEVTVGAESVSAKAAILIEADSGRVLFEKNPYEKLPMASTTKIMTAVVALEKREGALEGEVKISPSAAGVEGSSMYLREGEVMSLKDLIYGLMLSSGNDAAIAVAEEIAGSEEEFVKMMNDKAKELEMNDTHFSNPNGLPDEEHYSTAADMAKLCAYAMKNPKFATVVSTQNYRIDREGTAYPRELSNHNRLLKMYEGCVGVKTGYTKAAGRCLVSCAKRNGMMLICVTLNDPNDWEDHMRLFDYGFENYTYTKIADSTKPLWGAVVGGAEVGAVPLYPQEDLYYPLSKGEGFSQEMQVYPEISAPLQKGEICGRLTVSVCESESGGTVAMRETNLVNMTDVQLHKEPKSHSFKETLTIVFESWLTLFGETN